MTLDIAWNLKLPIDAVTQKLAFLGRTGSGKTYAAMKLAEEMLKAHAQVVCFDPVGVWWGLRLAADGKSPGIPVTVFGGLHGDLPLESTAGALIADVIVDRGISAIVDVSQFISAEQNRFATDFAVRLFDRKKSAPSAVMVFLEECQEFIPQNPMKGEERMLHAFQRMGKIGRNFGIGLGLISQRPQEVNKKVLNQTECVFAFQMTGPHERKAIREWVAEKGVDMDVVDILPKLPVGHAHVWSPQWLQISDAVKISPKWTFNASSTPTVGGKAVEVKPLAPIDIEQLQKDMAAQIERAKAEDPRELRKRIAELERRLMKATVVAADPDELQGQFDSGVRSVKVALAKELRAYERAAFHLLSRTRLGIGEVGKIAEREMAAYDQAGIPKMPSLDDVIGTVIQAGNPQLTHYDKSPQPANATGPALPMELKSTTARKAGIGDQRAASRTGAVQGGLQRMLIALAQMPQGLSARQLGVRAGLSSKSGTFGTYLAQARKNGWIEGTRDQIGITPKGVNFIGEYQALPEGKELLEHWVNELGAGAARMLAELASVYPKPLTAGQLGEAAGISSSSGTFGTYLSKLRSLELITGSRNDLRASEELV